VRDSDFSVGSNCRHDCDRGLAGFEFATHRAIRKVEVRAAPLLLWIASSATLRESKAERDCAPGRRYESEPNMRANVRLSALALLWVVACNRPDSALFDNDGSLPIESASGAGGGQTAGGPSLSGGVANNAGTSSTTPLEPAGAAGSSGNPTAGSGNVPVDHGTAGAMDAAGGSAEPAQPTVPVCGNGLLEVGEQCDDAGHLGEDGCDEACKVACADFGTDAAESEDHHCYAGFDEADFEAAIEACKKRGAHLATVSSAAENKVVRTLVNNSKWLGGREDVSANAPGTDSYGWITGEPFTYTNWGEREPNHAKVRCSGYEQNCYAHCVAITGEGTWVNQSCAVADGYVCEWEPAGAK
jgi:cysteine-rich repeat protein